MDYSHHNPVNTDSLKNSLIIYVINGYPLITKHQESVIYVTFHKGYVLSDLLNCASWIAQKT